MIHLPPMLSSSPRFARRLSIFQDARSLGYSWLDALRVSGQPGLQGGVVTLGGRFAVSVNITDDRTFVTGAGAMAARQVTGVEAAYLVASGIAAGQCDKSWGDTVTLTTGQTLAHDLATGGNLVDSAGAPVVFAKLRGVVLAATGLAGVPNTTTVTIARHASAGVPIFSAVSAGIPPLSAGGMYAWCDSGAGVNVTAATADLINIINSAGPSAGATVIYVGTSA